MDDNYPRELIKLYSFKVFVPEWRRPRPGSSPGPQWESYLPPLENPWNAGVCFLKPNPASRKSPRRVTSWLARTTPNVYWALKIVQNKILELALPKQATMVNKLTKSGTDYGRSQTAENAGSHRSKSHRSYKLPYISFR